MRLNNLAPALAAALVLAVCTSIAAPPAMASEHEEPVGNLAELMRAILFPNSNFLFDVQVTDPGTPPEPGSEDDRSASALFSGIYTGWQVRQRGLPEMGQAVARGSQADLRRGARRGPGEGQRSDEQPRGRLRGLSRRLPQVPGPLPPVMPNGPRPARDSLAVKQASEPHA